MEIEALHPLFGARITGISVCDLSGQQSDTLINAVEKYGVIVIPGQH
jgi:hypothetical protein